MAPDVRHSALVSDDPLVAQIIEGPVYWVDERLPDLVIEATYDTGGFVDFTQASATILRISRYRRRQNVATIAGSCTNVNCGRGQVRFVMPAPSPFASPGNYLGQIEMTVGGKTHKSQRFLIRVEESVP